MVTEPGTTAEDAEDGRPSVRSAQKCPGRRYVSAIETYSGSNHRDLPAKMADSAMRANISLEQTCRRPARTAANHQLPLISYDLLVNKVNQNNNVIYDDHRSN